jgi:FixJ family two-component response regulator
LRASQAFSSAEAFLASEDINETKCLILDVAMPCMSGPDLQQELRRRRQEVPIVFITGRGDETIRPRLLADGAAECLFKPFSEAALLDALNKAALRVMTMVTLAIASRSSEGLTMPNVTSIVFVVDDDVSVRESLKLLIIIRVSGVQVPPPLPTISITYAPP